MSHTNFSGLWHADLSKSRITGPAPSKILIKIAHDADELRQAVLSTRVHGEQDRVAARYSMTAAETTSELHGLRMTSRVRWNGPELVIELTYAGNEFRDYWSLSDDGRVLTMEHRDDVLAGQITILERVA